MFFELDVGVRCWSITGVSTSTWVPTTPWTSRAAIARRCHLSKPAKLAKDPFFLALFRATLGRLKNFKEVPSTLWVFTGVWEVGSKGSTEGISRQGAWYAGFGSS